MASPDAAGPDLRALVTGASSGIGAAFARELRRRGHRLILVARRADRLARMAEELGGGEAVASIPLDLAAPAAGQRLEDEVRARGLAVDLLVNNAGVGTTGLFHETALERHLAVVDLNARVLVELSRRFLPAMVQRGRGSLVNVVSMSAFQPVPYLATYAASKAFALSLTEALAVELRDTGVTVQALCPGNIPTEFQAVAGTDRVRFNDTPRTTAEEVVRVSLDALPSGGIVVIPGARDRLTVAAQRFVPRALVRRLAGELFRPQTDRG